MSNLTYILIKIIFDGYKSRYYTPMVDTGAQPTKIEKLIDFLKQLELRQSLIEFEQLIISI